MQVIFVSRTLRQIGILTLHGMISVVIVDLSIIVPDRNQCGICFLRDMMMMMMMVDVSVHLC